MRWSLAVVRWCLGLSALSQLIWAANEKVCADLVGTGGIGVRVWPTLKASPLRLHQHLTFRLVQINWEAAEITERDWVGVFLKDPRPPMQRKNPLGLPTPQNDSMPPWDMPAPLYWGIPYASKGHLTSNVTQGRIEPQMLASGGCVGVWTAFIRNGVAVAADCLASHPDWLWKNRDVLGSRSLRSLIIPGTHNSGSFSLNDEDDVVSAWVVCQDEDIISQLLFGIRYLDLRVAYYPHTPEKLWVNHDLVQWRPLEEVLNDVLSFLNTSKDPIIIDIHRTPVGFEFPEAVPLLLSFMNHTLGQHFLPDRLGPQVTLDQIWSIKKHIIFAYIDSDVADEEDWIWPPLPQAWANAQTLGDLQHYLDGQMTLRQSSPRIWAAMVHLTPSFWDVVLRSHEGVRGLSDRANHIVTTWLQKRWSHLANIVASDFFRGNNIINLAIRTNLALSVCPSGSTYRPQHSYKSSASPRRSTELTGKFTSPLIVPTFNIHEAMRSRSMTSGATHSPLLHTLAITHSSSTSESPHPSSSGVRREPISRSLQSGRFPQEMNMGRMTSASNRRGSSITTPIHSLLDVFGFNTTNTSTIASRFIPRAEDNYDAYDEQDNTDSIEVLYDYDADLLTNVAPHKQGDDFFIQPQTSRQLPLILETSMSIALQGDYEDDELHNSGDIPFNLPSTQIMDENQDTLQNSSKSSQTSVKHRKNDSASLKNIDSGNVYSNNFQSQEGTRTITESGSSLSYPSQNQSPTTTHQSLLNERHLSDDLDDFS